MSEVPAPALRYPFPARQAEDDLDAPSVPQRRIVKCEEWEDLRLPADELFVAGRLQVYDHIAASKYLNVYLSGSAVVFTATHFIGHIPLNDHIALNVIPRFDVSNLTRLLRIAQHSPVPLEQFVRTYLPHEERLPSIFDELAAAFLQAVEVIARSGLLTTYTQRTEDTSYPRGRILVDATVRRHHARGTPFRASSAWFERTADNAPNRLLKYTMWVLDRRLAAGNARKGILQLRTRLNRYYRAFSGARLDRSRRFLFDPDVLDPRRLPAVRSYYVQAIQLAALLVRENSLDLGKPGGTIQAPSMLVDLQEAFEAYLRNSLSDVLKERRAPLQVLDGNRGQPSGAGKGLFDEAGSRAATPDIVLRPAGSDAINSLLVEVKYKARPSREDVNQAIAYGASYRCPVVVLAHPRPKGESAHLRLEGSIGKMRVYRYAYDLAATLEAEEQLFAETIQRLVAETSSA